MRSRSNDIDFPLTKEIIVKGTLPHLMDFIQFEQARAADRYSGLAESESVVLPLQLYGPIVSAEGIGENTRWLVTNGYHGFLSPWKEGRDVQFSGPSGHLNGSEGTTLSELDVQARRQGVRLGSLLGVPELWIGVLPGERLRITFNPNRSADAPVFWRWVDSLLMELQRLGFELDTSSDATAEGRGIPERVWRELNNLLLECDAFQSAETLRSLFADPQLLPFQNDLPEANTRRRRVADVLAFLKNRRGGDGQHGLVLLVSALMSQVDRHDDQYRRLRTLLEDLDGCLDC
jgi:hypothetical protein